MEEGKDDKLSSLQRLQRQAGLSHEDRFRAYLEDATLCAQDALPEETAEMREMPPKPKRRAKKASKKETKLQRQITLTESQANLSTRKLEFAKYLDEASASDGDQGEPETNAEAVLARLQDDDESTDSEDADPLDITTLLQSATAKSDKHTASLPSEMPPPPPPTDQKVNATVPPPPAAPSQVPAAPSLATAPKAPARTIPKPVTDSSSSGLNYTVRSSSGEIALPGDEKLSSIALPMESSTAVLPSASSPMNDFEFYWLDAKEQSYSHAVDPGSVFLFGKLRVPESDGAGQWRSCCLRVNGMFRSVLLVPKEGASPVDVVTEVTRECSRHHITSNIHIKPVRRWYAFEETDIPQESSEWFKLKYPARFPPLSQELRLSSVQKAIGMERSLVELLLVKRRFQGPSFVKVTNPIPVGRNARISHCTYEYILESPKHVSVVETPAPPPPLRALSIQLATQLDANGLHNEIFGASIVVCPNVSVDSSGNKEVPPCNRIVAIRQFDDKTPISFEVKRMCDEKAVVVFTKEAELLRWIIDTIAENDPDIFVGHSFTAFTLDLLLHRLSELSRSGPLATLFQASSLWSTLGRLQVRRMPKLQSGAGGTRDATFQEREVCAGRLICDTYLLSREHYKTSNYKLLALACSMGLRGLTGPVTQEQAEEPTATITPKTFATREACNTFVVNLLNISVLALGVAYHLDVIPLTKRLSYIAGNLWSRTLSGSRAERIEFLLLHSFHRLKFVTPDRQSYKTIDRKHKRGDDDDLDEGDEPQDEEENPERGRRARAKYKGGKVLEPKRGLYTDYVLLLDFNSLYPSIIQEFNICFTTVERGRNIEAASVPDPEKLICNFCSRSGKGDVWSGPCEHKCVLPKVIRSLVQQRREVKKLIKETKDPSLVAQLDIRQKALKLTANSMYGCLGFEYSRFYAQPLAELVTRQGREALTNTVDLVPTIHPTLQVIYGDTDSVMVSTGIPDDLAAARAMAEKIKSEVNKKYKSLEIDIDGVYHAILLMRKKKYACTAVIDWAGAGTQTKQEVKGLDMVRRDWCPLSHRTSQAVLDIILSRKESDDAIEQIFTLMGKIADECREGRVGLHEYCISKSLTKEPEHYKGTSFPHAAVALRMKQRKEPVRVGDLIPYVIVDTGTEGATRGLAARAFHIDELRRNPQRIDVEWYLENQVVPPVLRMCELLPGFSRRQLGEVMCLASLSVGVDTLGEGTRQETSKYCSAFRTAELEDLEAAFGDVEPLQVACAHCRKVSAIQPHKFCRQLVNGEFQKSRDDEPRIINPVRTMIVDTQLDAAEMESARIRERELQAKYRFWIYRCTSCGRHFSLPVVTNLLINECQKVIRNFYRCRGSAVEEEKLRSQMRYYRVLFDVPHFPGCEPELKLAHQHALRLWDGRNLPCSIAEERKTIRDEAARKGRKLTEEELAEIQYFNPPLEYIKKMFNRMDQMFVDMETLL